MDKRAKVKITKRFEKTFIIICDYTNKSELERIGIKRAFHVIIMATAGNTLGAGITGEFKEDDDSDYNQYNSRK